MRMERGMSRSYLEGAVCWEDSGIVIEGLIINVASSYAQQEGCELKDKQKFWSELDDVILSIPRIESMMIGADFNRPVDEEIIGDEEVMG